MSLYDTQSYDHFCFVTVESSVAKRKAPCKTKSSRSHVMKLARHRAKTDPNAKWYRSSAENNTDINKESGVRESNPSNSYTGSQGSLKEELAHCCQAFIFPEGLKDQEKRLLCGPGPGCAGGKQKEEEGVNTPSLAPRSYLPKQHDRLREIKKGQPSLLPAINLTDMERHMHCGLYLCKRPQHHMRNELSQSYCVTTRLPSQSRHSRSSGTLAVVLIFIF